LVIIVIIRGGNKMRITTNTNDKIKLEEASAKAKRLCKLYNCGLIELLVMSIDGQAEKKQEQNKN
jgi:C-terminal processing protease CtpA/Prc